MPPETGLLILMFGMLVVNDLLRTGSISTNTFLFGTALLLVAHFFPHLAWYAESRSPTVPFVCIEGSGTRAVSLSWGNDDKMYTLTLCLQTAERLRALNGEMTRLSTTEGSGLLPQFELYDVPNKAGNLYYVSTRRLGS
jgi:hypothetical protein